MLRFILVVLANVKRGPYLIPKMRKMFHHPERYSEQVRYAFAQKLINYMKFPARSRRKSMAPRIYL